MRAQVGHCVSSWSSYWRDDAPQVVSASNHDFFAQCSSFPCFILCYLLEGFLNSVRGPFRGFHFSPESVFFILPTFQRGETFLHHSFRGIRVMAAIHLLQVFYGWRFQLRLSLYSCLLFFFSQPLKPLYSGSFMEKVSHVHGSFPIILQIIPRYAFFSTTCLHCTFVNVFSPVASENC